MDALHIAHAVVKVEVWDELFWSVTLSLRIQVTLEHTDGVTFPPLNNK